MKKLAVIILVLCLSSVALAQPDHLLGKEATTVVPERFLRGYDPVTVFFQTPPLGDDKHGPEDHPEVLAKQQVFQMMPEHPGELIWIDAQTLQFIPAIPAIYLSSYDRNDIF